MHMKTKNFSNRILLGIAILCPGVLVTPATAQVHVEIGIPLPPPIVFVAPPQVVVLPGFDIYVAPDVAEEVYFVDGFWWRPWQGRWYRSQSYDNGWNSYAGVPSFYGNVHQDWRSDYRDRRWQGQQWNYERVSYDRAEQNWSSWKSSNYWRSREKGGAEYKSASPKAAHSKRQAVAPQPAANRSKAEKQHSQKPKGKPEKQMQKQKHGGDGDKGKAEPAAQHGNGKGKDKDKH